MCVYSFAVKLLFCLFFSEYFSLFVWQLATSWAFKYYCSHITVLTSFSCKFVYAVECVAGSIVSSSYYACFLLWLFDSFILYVLRLPRWMKVTEKMLQKLTVDVNRDVFFKPILRYNLAFVFQGTVGRRNTKLRNESVIFVCISVRLSFDRILSLGFCSHFILNWEALNHISVVLFFRLQI